jgi:hypothetical protein
MDTSGYSGVDLFAFDTVTKMFRWVTTWETPNFPNNTGLLVEGLNFPTSPTLYRLNFPLYNRVSELFVGVGNASIFTPNMEADMNRKNTKKFVWYGTSIAQGMYTSAAKTKNSV